MVAGDCGERRPVDTRRGPTLLRIGGLFAQPLLVADAGILPVAVEQHAALGVELLDGQHQDVAVLWIDPGARRAGGRDQARHGRGPDHTRRDRRHRHFPPLARSSSTKRSSASTRASRGYAFWVTNSEPIVSCERAIGTA